YNQLFKEQFLNENNGFDKDIKTIINNINTNFFSNSKSFDVSSNKKLFTAFGSKTEINNKLYNSYYFIEDTKRKQIESEYYLSKPSVILLYVDNLEESFRDLKDSEKVKILGKIENILDEFINETNGFMRKLDRDRFLAVIEHRHMEAIIEKRFEILDIVRKIETGNSLPVTVSIGVGTNGKDLAEDEEFARQALDMALGRGGDQAAVKSDTGYEFYGGVSKGVEKRSKIKTRIMASAITEMIETADNVIVMGHLAADLDCLASAAVLAKCVKEMGKEAFVAINKSDNLATSLYEKLNNNGYSQILCSPEESIKHIKKNTLLIVTDTHNTKSIQSPQLLSMCDNVIVIDHHRKMVNYIEKAVVFYHEPFASSASEMVAELMQYMAPKNVMGRIEAEALLSGIMLDTKNFLLKTGVRTFEAAAYLRKLGADTTEVKKMFSSTMDVYRLKT
ncbi:MAG: DHH family phosphoesterase, partial [Oscillospiraceae bacterium]